MRWSFTFVLLFTFLAAQSQDIQVHLDTHRWAGGMCCSHGVNYTYTFKIPKGEWQDFDSLLVCDGGQVLRYGAQKNTASNGDTLVFNVSFGHTYGESYGEKMQPVSTPNCSEPLVLVRGHQRKSLTVTSRSESMVAYP